MVRSLGAVPVTQDLTARKENKMEAKKAKKKIKLQDLKLKNDVKGGMLACGPAGNPPTHNPPKGYGPQTNRFNGP